MRHQRGFTIIEVLLFLSISGLLMALLFVGTGVAIQRQQYQDTVQSFATFLRGQYSAMVNVENDHEGDAVCPIAAAGATGHSSISPPPQRGQTDCLIIGRYIQADSNEGRRYRAFPIYAKKQSGGWQYRYGDNSEEYYLNWDGRTKLAGRDHADQVQFSLAMYRHPGSGEVTIKTAGRAYAPGEIRDFINSPANSHKQEVCVYDIGWLPNERLSVVISPNTGLSDAVVIAPSTNGSCQDA